MGQGILDGCYVIHGGRISPYGTVRILHKSARHRETGNPEEGLAVYSDKLLKYAYPLFAASIKQNCLAVMNQGRIIATIEEDELKHSHELELSEVMENGWLRPSLKISHQTERRLTIQELLRADKGERVSYDGSPFYRVSSDLIGKELMLIVFWQDGEFRVVDPITHKLVDSQVEYPLKRGRFLFED